MNGTLRIADMPIDERPRERLIRHGAQTLSDAELVAILLGSGTQGQSSLDVARTLLDNGLAGMARREWSRERGIRGLGAAKTARIDAAFELGRRLAGHQDTARDPVRDPDSLARSLVARYAHHMQERLGVVFLDAKSRVIHEREIYVGTLNATTVSTRDVMRFALQENAASIIVFHNHPSGDPAPSAEDIIFTKRIIEAGRLMGVDVVDHLILGLNRYVSLKQRGVM